MGPPTDVQGGSDVNSAMRSAELMRSTTTACAFLFVI
jgi:hypothetical protein